jgi:hypothetical protein
MLGKLADHIWKKVDQLMDHIERFHRRLDGYQALVYYGSLIVVIPLIFRLLKPPWDNFIDYLEGIPWILYFVLILGSIFVLAWTAFFMLAGYDFLYDRFIAPVVKRVFNWLYDTFTSEEEKEELRRIREKYPEEKPPTEYKGPKAP